MSACSTKGSNSSCQSKSSDDYSSGATNKNFVLVDSQSDDHASDINLESQTQETPANLMGVGWIVINTLATIAIVFTNKAIFTDPQIRLKQSSFAAFHFAMTSITLLIASGNPFNIFKPIRVRLLRVMPLATAMCLNVVLPNMSLAYSTIAFYQIMRVLLTPMVALINLCIIGTKVPRDAIYFLIPVCLGIGITTVYDTKAQGENIAPTVGNTTPLGVFFAFSGVLASSLYTVWIASYQRQMHLNSFQLLLNLAPTSAFLLLYIIPFTDVITEWHMILPYGYWMVLLSGFLAALINISQFFIVADAGPVSSTVVGHLKTCSIVALGWLFSGRPVTDGAVLGTMLAISGIVGYSVPWPVPRTVPHWSPSSGGASAPYRSVQQNQHDYPSILQDEIVQTLIGILCGEINEKSLFNMIKQVFLIWGSRGWIAGHLYELLRSRDYRVETTSIRMEEREAVKAELERVKPTHVLNCAGVTGRPNVDWCEDNKEATIRSNVIGTINLTDLCFLLNIHVTVFATGCIYTYNVEHPIGGLGFKDEDAANFQGSFYSYTKSRVEDIIKHYPNALILRLRMPVSDDLHPRNFVTKISKYPRVVNIPNSHSILHDLLPCSILLANNFETGIYNLTNPGAITHNEVLSMFRDIVRPGLKWENFTLEEQAQVIKAERSNCFLDTGKLEHKIAELGGGMKVPSIREAYEACFRRMAERGIE